MDLREQIADVLHDFYIEASTRKITREEFDAFIDRIIALVQRHERTGSNTDAPPEVP